MQILLFSVWGRPTVVFSSLLVDLMGSATLLPGSTDGESQKSGCVTLKTDHIDDN